MDLTDAMNHARVEQDSFGQRRLARVDMRRNADVTSPLKRKRTIRRIETSAHRKSKGERVIEGE